MFTWNITKSVLEKMASWMEQTIDRGIQDVDVVKALANDDEERSEKEVFED
jgi:hypothetical protein